MITWRESYCTGVELGLTRSRVTLAPKQSGWHAYLCQRWYASSKLRWYFSTQSSRFPIRQYPSLYTAYSGLVLEIAKLLGLNNVSAGYLNSAKKNYAFFQCTNKRAGIQSHTVISTMVSGRLIQEGDRPHKVLTRFQRHHQ